MMLLHRLFLLVMLIGMSSSEPKTNCEEENMACFAAGPCTVPPDADTDLAYIKAKTVVGDFCEAIVKIRSYTAKHILIRMESYDSEVTNILLEQETTKFECNKEGNKVVAKYMDSEQNMIAKNGSVLACEFYVKIDDEIFNTEVLKLTSSKSTNVYTMGGHIFKAFITPTCDRDQVNVQRTGGSDDKIYSEVNSKFAKLECPVGFKLMFKEGAQFMEASSIVCDKENKLYGYRPTLIPPAPSPHALITEPFNAHCETTVCKVCDMSLVPSNSVPILEIKEEGGCNVLKCKTGRMQIDSRDPVEGSAECKKDNDKAVWKFNEEIIKKETEIACVEKMECSADIAKALCPGCAVGTNNVPFCLSPSKLSLEGKTLELNIICDESRGKFELNDNGNKFDAEGNKLVCVDITPQPDAAKTSTGSSSTQTVIYVVVAFVVIGLIVGAVVGYRLYIKKKKRGATPRTELNTAKERKSKEGKSKSLNESKNDEKKEEKREEKKGETPAAESKENTPHVPWVQPKMTDSERERLCKLREHGDTTIYPGDKDPREQETDTSKKQEGDTTIGGVVAEAELKIMKIMKRDLEREKADLMAGKGLDVTQQSGGQSEDQTGAGGGKTAVIPAGPGSK